MLTIAKPEQLFLGATSRTLVGSSLVGANLGSLLHHLSLVIYT